MIKNLLLAALFFTGAQAFSQCIGSSQYPSSAVTSNNDSFSQEITDCNFADEYATINTILIGSNYRFSTNITSYLTLTDVNNNVLASGPSPLVYNNATVTTVRLHIFEDAICSSSGFNCYSDSITCTSCTPPVAPECVTLVSPLNGTTGVSATDSITFTWTAPTTGVTPTSYDFYAGETPSGDDYGLIVNTTSTTVTFPGINEFNKTLYWKVVAKNGSAEATGCTVFSFTTQAPPPAPINDTACGAITLAMNTATTGGLYNNIGATFNVNENLPACFIDDSLSTTVWFKFTATTTFVKISTDSAGGTMDDTQLALYSATNCADLNSFTELACNDDISGSNYLSELSYDSLTVGGVYYIQVDGYNNQFGTFDINIVDDTNAVVVVGVEKIEDIQVKYFPNPVTNDVLTIQSDKTMEAITIYSISQQVVLSVNANSTLETVNMNGLANGSYIVRVMTREGAKSFKVLKQ